MTPAEAKARYEAEWPTLNAAKDAATTPQAVRKCRQALSALSSRYAARFELNKPEPELCDNVTTPPEGMQLVPVEPTAAMVEAAVRYPGVRGVKDAYRMMLRAARDADHA